jgi:hypothetical protein
MAIVKRKKTGLKAGSLITNKSEPKSAVKKVAGDGTSTKKDTHPNATVKSGENKGQLIREVLRKTHTKDHAVLSKLNANANPANNSPKKIDSKKDSSRGK